MLGAGSFAQKQPPATLYLAATDAAKLATWEDIVIKKLAFVLSCAAAFCVTSAFAQDKNLEKLGGFKTTGTPMMEPIPQTGENAEALKAIAAKVKVPDGFKVNLYAIVPDARHMAVGPQGVVTFVGTPKELVYSMTDRDKDRVADDVKVFAPSIKMTVPNGVCFSRDGHLYLVEQNRVLWFPGAEFFYEGPDVAAFAIVKQGELIPASDESYNHTARTCRVGPDNRIYITIGQPFNVPAPELLPEFEKLGIGGVISMKQDGTDRKIYARGMRNPLGLDFNPKDKTLWVNDNQVDGMGDTIPPGEMNHVTGPDQNFGFPWYGGGKTRTVEYKDAKVPEGVIFPEVEQEAHAADLGLSFYTGKQFPEKYRGGIFSTQHGSWNRVEPVGARVMFTSLKEDGTAGKTEVFADGWLSENGEYLGRPVDVQMLIDGSLLVSDDLAGAVWRISYGD
ncbi:MAG: sorbosone dehydrogenase [Mesorhizobium sp.]|nr:MAG: sorbosone dehydrogenase [Mesorhizobium sp.]